MRSLPFRLACWLLMATVMTQSGLVLAQSGTAAPPADPVDEATYGALRAAVPSDGLETVALVHVGQLLSPAALQLVLEALSAIAGSDEHRQPIAELYAEALAPVAAAVGTCLIWWRDEPGLVCAGDFSAGGLDLLAEPMADCAAEGGGEERCGSSESLFSGHRVDYVTAPEALVRIDDRFVVLAADADRARQHAGRLIAVLDGDAQPPALTLGGVALDPSAALHLISQPPPSVLADPFGTFLRGETPERLAAQLHMADDDVRLWLQVEMSDAALAEQVAGLLNSGAAMVLVAAADRIGIDRERARSHLSELRVSVDDRRVEATFDEPLLSSLLAAIGLIVFAEQVTDETEDAPSETEP